MMTTTIERKLPPLLTRTFALIVAVLIAGCNRLDPDEEIDPDPMSEPPVPELFSN